MDFKKMIATKYQEKSASDVLDIMGKLMGAGTKPLPPPGGEIVKVLTPVRKKTQELPQLPAKICADGKKRRTLRADVPGHFAGEPWPSLTESEHYVPALACLLDGTKDMPAIPAFYFGHGGDELKKALKDPELRREAIVDILATQAVDNVILSQICGGVLGASDSENMINEISVGKGYFQEIYNVKCRADQNSRNALESLARVNSLASASIMVKGACQVNLGQQVQDGSGSVRPEIESHDADTEASPQKTALQKTKGTRKCTFKK